MDKNTQRLAVLALEFRLRLWVCSSRVFKPMAHNQRWRIKQRQWRINRKRLLPHKRSQIVDTNGSPVRLTGVSWFGMETDWFTARAR